MALIFPGQLHEFIHKGGLLLDGRGGPVFGGLDFPVCFGGDVAEAGDHEAGEGGHGGPGGQPPTQAPAPLLLLLLLLNELLLKLELLLLLLLLVLEELLLLLLELLLQLLLLLRVLRLGRLRSLGGQRLRACAPHGGCGGEHRIAGPGQGERLLNLGAGEPLGNEELGLAVRGRWADIGTGQKIHSVLDHGIQNRVVVVVVVEAIVVVVIQIWIGRKLNRSLFSGTHVDKITK